VAGPIEDFRDMIDDDWDNRAAAGLARRSDRLCELRLAAEAAPREDGDRAALKLSALSTGADCATPSMATTFHVEWLRAEARELLERRAEHLGALAAALYGAVELTGAEVETIVRAIPCPCRC
jgi:hypothetical protein